MFFSDKNYLKYPLLKSLDTITKLIVLWAFAKEKSH